MNLVKQKRFYTFKEKVIFSWLLLFQSMPITNKLFDRFRFFHYLDQIQLFPPPCDVTNLASEFVERVDNAEKTWFYFLFLVGIFVESGMNILESCSVHANVFVINFYAWFYDMFAKKFHLVLVRKLLVFSAVLTNLVNCCSLVNI